MIDKIFEKIEELRQKNNLVLRVREPPACVFCSAPRSINKYEAAYAKSNKFVVSDASEIDNLVLLERIDEITFKCPECGAERVPTKYLNVPMWWVTCTKCNDKQLSLVDGKCPTCDHESKQAKESFIKNNGG